jgi:hypothetical protein
MKGLVPDIAGARGFAEQVRHRVTQASEHLLVVREQVVLSQTLVAGARSSIAHSHERIARMDAEKSAGLTSPET